VPAATWWSSGFVPCYWCTQWGSQIPNDGLLMQHLSVQNCLIAGRLLTENMRWTTCT